MRYRQSNLQETGRNHAKSLINSDDVLSTREQEEVLQYLAASMKFTNRFLVVVAGLHLLLAVVYVILLVSGSPLVGDIESSAQAQSLQELTAYAQQLNAAAAGTKTQQKEAAAGEEAGVSPHGKTAAKNNDHAGADAIEATLARLRASKLSAEKNYAMDFLAQRATRGTSSGASRLSTGVVLATLESAALLVIGGYGCWRAYRALGVSTEQLLRGEPRDVHRRTAHHCNGSDNNSNSAGDRNNDRNSTDASDANTRRTDLQSHSLRPTRLVESARVHYGIALLALLPTLYWLTSLYSSRKALNSVYEQYGRRAGGGGTHSDAGLSASLFDRMIEIVLIVWQPIFHAGMGYMIRSMYDSRAQLVALSQLKYGYEKI